MKTIVLRQYCRTCSKCIFTEIELGRQIEGLIDWVHQHSGHYVELDIIRDDCPHDPPQDRIDIDEVEIEFDLMPEDANATTQKNPIGGR